MYDTATPYIASYIILRREGKIAFVLRQNTKWMNGFYSLPAGKTEKNESFSAGAIREAREEAGVTIEPSELTYVHTMHRNEGMDWVDVFFEAKSYAGEPHNAEPDMHAELAWLDPKNLPENVIPSLAYALGQIEDGVAYSEYGWN